jgi:transcriptional regulator with XRE-family HTH domain
MLELTRRRLQRGWTKSELARRSRMAVSAICLIESGRFIPYDTQLRKIARAMGLPASQTAVLMAEARPGSQA